MYLSFFITIQSWLELPDEEYGVDGIPYVEEWIGILGFASNNYNKGLQSQGLCFMGLFVAGNGEDLVWRMVWICQDSSNERSSFLASCTHDYVNIEISRFQCEISTAMEPQRTRKRMNFKG
jgi:hypothetical protein